MKGTKLDVGESVSVSCMQLAILTGCPSDQMKLGHSFAWGKGMFQVESVSGEEALLRRMGSAGVVAWDQSQPMNPSSFQELDAWDDGYPPHEVGSLTVKTIPGKFEDPSPTDDRGTGIVPKKGVFPSELKSPRPAIKNNPSFVNELVASTHLRLFKIRSSHG